LTEYGFGTPEIAQQLATAVSDVFAVQEIVVGPRHRQVIKLRGQLLTDSDQAYTYIARRFKGYGYTPLLRQEAGHVLITALPVIFAVRPARNYLAILLFALTVISVLFAASGAQAADWQGLLHSLLTGLPFAASLLAILTAHELGHYFMARRLGVPVSLPYFIPMPLSPFGTMGAVIRMRAPTRNRRQLLAIGSAGPIAGLAVALPVLIIGLLHSTVQPIPMQPGVWLEGNSVLYAAVKLLIFGQILPHDGYDVFLHPVAFAAWAGLLVTALNLIPAGQLDGGHIAYALFGQHTRWLNRLAVVAALVLGFVWSGWFVWAAILLLLGQRNAQPLDDITPLTTRQKVLGICMLIIFVLLFTPVPISIL